MSLCTQLRLHGSGSRSLLLSLTGGMIPGPNCEHTHLPSRSSVPLFRTNRYIKHSVLWMGKVWGKTLDWDNVGQQLIYLVLYLYFSLTFCHHPHSSSPPPSQVNVLKFLSCDWTQKVIIDLCQIRTHRSAMWTDLEASRDDKPCLSFSLVASWI